MRNLLATVLFVATTAANAASIQMYDFPLKNGQSRDDIYKMSEHKNAVFVFEAFSINCGYCHQNAPVVDQFATEYASNPRVQVLDLGLDRTDSAFAEWISTHSPNHPVIQDTDRRVYNALRTENGIPQVFVVNCRGEMVGNHVGTWDGDVQRIRDLVTKALETTCE
jgi:thiol-disulfide isomerase/thioredoxin